LTVFELAAVAYLVDMIFGEFPCKHPVVWMGEFISGLKKRFIMTGFYPARYWWSAYWC